MSLISEQMRSKLIAAFQPEKLEIVNESSFHADHFFPFGKKGDAVEEEPETHFRIFIVSSFFCGMNRIEGHRCIHSLLADELKNYIHALAIEIFSPDE